MDELFALVWSLTFLLSLVVSSLVMVLVWIAIPDIDNHRVLTTAIILCMSLALTIHYSKQEYNPDKHYKTLADRYHEFKNERASGK
ncbi:putative membrane protein [Salmonella phage SW16-7]|nr:putative membrane protein [Salmonella phage SW16-7]